MRTLLSTAFCLLLVSAIAATAEPPPQSVATPAVTVAAVALPAIRVTQVDTSAQAASSTARVDTAAADKREGHGLGFWAVIAAVVLILIVLGVRWFSRRGDGSEYRTASSEEPPDRTRPPGSTGRK